jgi:hypothetical protein
MIKIPNESKRVVQTNRSDILGNLWSTYNLDLTENLGAIRVSPRMKLNTGSLNGCPWGFRFFDTKIWAGAGTLIYSNSGVPNGTFVADASTGFQSDFSSDESDMETFNGTLCATTTDGLYSKASNGSGTGAWTQKDILATGGQHVLCYFKKFDLLYYSNAADNIISIDTSWATSDPGSSYAISLSNDSGAYTITSMKATSTSIFIGILDKTKEGAVGKIVEWDGLSSQIEREYPLQAQGCLSILIDKERDTPFAMDSNGILLKFNGTGFSEVGRLPITLKLLQSMNDVDNERFIHPNGLQFSREGTILAHVNNINADTTYNENFQSGVYEFIPQSDGTYSCHHKESPSYTAISTVTDFGQTQVSRVGAIAPVNTYSSSSDRNGTHFIGATYFTNATSTASAIFYDDSRDTLQKAGYFVTTKIYSDQLTDVWQKVFPRFKRLLDSADRIVVKYRKVEETPVIATITWQNTTLFSTTDSSLVEGDEVEVLRGLGSGLCAHVTAIEQNGSTYFITIDETATGVIVGDTATARFQNWTKAGEVAQQVEEFEEYAIAGDPSVWIQFKVWMLFKGKDEFIDLSVAHINHKTIQ